MRKAPYPLDDPPTQPSASLLQYFHFQLGSIAVAINEDEGDVLVRDDQEHPGEHRVPPSDLDDQLVGEVSWVRRHPPSLPDSAAEEPENAVTDSVMPLTA